MAVITPGEKPQKTHEKTTGTIYIYPHHHCSICGKMIEDPEKKVCAKRCKETYDLQVKRAQRRRRFMIYTIIYSVALFFVMLYMFYPHS